MKINNILIVCMNLMPYISLDAEILSRKYNTFILDMNKKNIFMYFKKLIRYIIWSDVVFIWFINIHSFLTLILCKFLRKKTILVASGYSVANLSSIKYGNMQNTILKIITLLVLNNVDVITSVSKFNKKEISLYTNKEVKNIYHGINMDKFMPLGNKKNIVITVGNINKSNLKRKGLVTFILTAKYMLDTPFYLIGRYTDDSIYHLKKIASKNVFFTGYVDEPTLISYYQQAKIYVQLSAHEAFGMSLAEAMSCECVPVTTSNGSIPEVVDGLGYFVNYDDPLNTAIAIKNAMLSRNGYLCRKRICDLFSLKKRESYLIDILNNLYKIK